LKPTRDQLLLLAILCLGLFLRIYHLGGESFWIDEQVTIRLAHKSFAAIIKNRAHNFHPPFYFLLERCWVGLFGDSEFAARFLSVLFGFFAMCMVYKVGRLLFDKEVGLFASLLLALSTFHIRYSQETRSYSLMVLLTLLSVYFLLKLQRKDTNHWDLVGYTLSTSLLIYTHYYGLFIVIMENLYIAGCLLFKRHLGLSWKKWVLLQVSMILLFAPWIPVLINQFLRVQRKGGFSGADTPSLDSIRGTFQSYAGTRMVMALMIALAILSLATYVRRKRGEIDRERDVPSRGEERPGLHFTQPCKLYLLSLWLVIPIGLPYLVSQISSPIYSQKYTIAASLAFYLLAAKGIRNLAYVPAKLTLTLILLALCLTNVWAYYQTPQKEEWREVAKCIDRSARAGDLILFNAGWCKRAFNYYSLRDDLVKEPFPRKVTRVDEKTIQELGPAVKGHDRVWVILSHSRDREGLIVKALTEKYGLIYHHQFHRVEVYLFEETKAGMSRQHGRGRQEKRSPIADPSKEGALAR
jgi:mannosyltransferase